MKQLFDYDEDENDFETKIIALGVGSSGSNILNFMTESGVQNIKFVAVDKDSDLDEIKERITGADLIFVIAGMGGKITTALAPVVSKIAKDAGIFTIGIVTKPFNLEHGEAQRRALQGIEEIRRNVDALLVLEKGAFRKSDKILSQIVFSIADLITKNGFVNLELDDVKNCLSGANELSFGIGEGEGEERVKNAVENAVRFPLFNHSLQNAEKVLLNVTTGTETLLTEVADAAYLIDDFAKPDAYVAWGHVIDESLGEKVRVTLIAAS